MAHSQWKEQIEQLSLEERLELLAYLVQSLRQDLRRAPDESVPMDRWRALQGILAHRLGRSIDDAELEKLRDEYLIAKHLSDTAPRAENDSNPTRSKPST